MTDLPKIAFISTPTNPPCGIGQYNADLVDSLHDKIEAKAFFEGLYWKRGTPLGKLAHEVLQWNPDLIHIQHAYGFFFLIPEFISFLQLIKDKPVVITMHEIPTYEHQLWYNDAKATFIFPHNQSYGHIKSKFGFNNKYAIIPHGSTLFEIIPKDLAIEKLNLPKDRIILTQCGFYSFGKGMKELVEAVSLLKKEFNPLLVFAGGIHPLAIEEDRRFLKKTMAAIVSLGLQQNVLFTGKHLSEDELNLWISASDILILNHQLVYPAISSSAIGKRIIASGKPAIFGDDPRLSDFKDMETCLKVKSNNPSDIADKIRMLINNKELQETLGENAKEFAYQTRWEEVGQLHLNLYRRLINETI